MSDLPPEFAEFVLTLDRVGLNRHIGERREQLATLQREDPQFARLSSELWYMWSVQRENRWDIDMVMDETSYIDPNVYDVLLSDVAHDLLMNDIAERLEVEYLETPKKITESPTPEITESPRSVSGILYGANMRPMVNLVVASQRHKKPINIIFLVDTGSPHLYICEGALAKLPKTFGISFGDTSFEANMSPREGHFKDINLMGSSFLTKTNATLTVNYAMNELSILFRD